MSWQLELDDDGTFHYAEEESNADYAMGADARGRWTIEGTALSLDITYSDFGAGRGAWRKGETERGTIDDGGVSLVNAEVPLVRSRDELA